jgi:phage terminase small subunit
MKQADGKKLNPRQQLFVDYYCSGMSATQAYIKAGYEPKDANKRAYLLRQNKVIDELIEQKKKESTQNIDDLIAFEEEASLMYRS